MRTTTASAATRTTTASMARRGVATAAGRRVATPAGGRVSAAAWGGVTGRRVAAWRRGRVTAAIAAVRRATVRRTAVVARCNNRLPHVERRPRVVIGTASVAARIRGRATGRRCAPRLVLRTAVHRFARGRTGRRRGGLAPIAAVVRRPRGRCHTIVCIAVARTRRRVPGRVPAARYRLRRAITEGARLRVVGSSALSGWAAEAAPSLARSVSGVTGPRLDWPLYLAGWG
jgi:hypothetical protein